MKIILTAFLFFSLFNNTRAQQTVTVSLNDSMKYTAPVTGGKKEGLGMVYLYNKKYFSVLFRADTVESLDIKKLFIYNKNKFRQLTISEDSIKRVQNVTLFTENSAIHDRFTCYDGVRFTTNKEGYLFWTMQDFSEISEWHIYPVEPDDSFRGFSGSGVQFHDAGKEKILKQCTKYKLKANTEYILGVSLTKELDGSLNIKGSGKSYTITINIVDDEIKQKWGRRFFYNK